MDSDNNDEADGDDESDDDDIYREATASELGSIVPKPLTLGHGVNKSVFEMYLYALRLGSATACSLRVMALKGMGFFFSRRPRLLLDPRAELITRQALEDSNFSVCAQVVYSLRQLLEMEERRLEAGIAQKQMQSRTNVKQQVSELVCLLQ